MIIDLGTGDGRSVLTRAAADDRAFVIGIDANAAGMAESSRRADRGRNRLENAMFIAEPAETLPGPLAAVADLVTVTMPWGSLLRGVLGLDERALQGVASVVAAGGRVEVLASVVPSDGIPGLDCLDEGTEPLIRAAWATTGIELDSMRRASADDLTAARSSWVRRLGERPIWRFALRRRS